MHAQFMQALFDGKPDDARILVWTLPYKRSAFFKDIDSAAYYAYNAGALDCYVGVGLRGRDLGEHSRGGDIDVIGIVGLWADIDIAGECHNDKKPYPSSAEEAATIIEELPEPSLTVHSGHGLQYWWLFKEPWMFDSHDERLSAKELSQRWTATIQHRARAKGYDVDSVYDLARVLRIPGTMNNKGEPVKVQLLSCEPGIRYDPSDFDEFLADAKVSRLGPEVVVGTLTLSESASPPFEKFDLLCSVNPKFKLSWEHMRKDLKDQSASTYDLSLASMASQAGWTDQEIADLIVAWRVKHGETRDDKHLREDYIARTIAKGRSDGERESASETLEDARFTRTESADERRAAILNAVSKLLDVQIARIVKLAGGEEGEYRLYTQKGEIQLGNIENLIKQERLRAKIADVAGVYFQPYKAATWTDIAKSLLQVCEEDTIGRDAGLVGMVKSWLSDYLAHLQPLPEMHPTEPRPFHKDGFIHVSGTHLRTWVMLNRHDKLTAKQFGVAMRVFGCEPRVMRVPGLNTSREVWRVPHFEQEEDQSA